ncbi:hypothetical protein K227x_07180 [Rubripirellula lacrimiformis]|uniref:Mce/MlaD domain-containing protein n=1 Tax=Rubripirellula lacrimiformis TaxID=1930273 RepID=A0A517N5C6_9BACT|nr:hypothetical protein [Rubripirellula lacrimiformis]QDT02342.1 hypothetical protein K227x_07180 [Rubripirellula lacrimiformis]
MNEPYRLRYTNQIVGAFLLVLLLFLIVLALLLLRASDYFVERKPFWFEISQEQIQDLHPGIEVMILGQLAGQVDNIRYVEDTDRVRVELSIDPGKSDQIFEDSVIVPARKYGVGTPVLNIRRPRSNAGPLVPLSPGQPITAFRSEDDRLERMSREVESVTESVRLIQEKLDPTLTTIDDAAAKFSTSLTDTVDPTFVRAQQASDSFLQTNERLRPEASETLRLLRQATESMQAQMTTLTKKIETLVDEDMRTTLAKVRQSTDEVSAAAKTANQTSSDVGVDIAETLEQLQQASEQVRQLAIESRQVVQIVRGEAEELPGTTARVNDTVNETQDLVGEIRGHWLLRRSSQRPTSTQQVSPSTVRGGFAR